MSDDSSHQHDHPHSHDHPHAGAGRRRKRTGHSHADGHTHGVLSEELTTHRAAIRAIWISVVGLGLTAAFQLVIVASSGSSALFADALHNLGDVAGTAALWVGFKLSRRPRSNQFTYGWRRAEDVAGLAVMVAIATSVVLAGWDSVTALLTAGHTIENPPFALAATLMGAAGNEAVAVYKIRVGRSIDSVSLAADGQHARIDALVSLGAAAGIAGAWLLDLPIIDPLAGLAITLIILKILITTGREVLARNLDAVDPSLVDEIRHVAASVEGVRGVNDIRARHAGRSLLIQLLVDVDGRLELHQAHDIAERVRHDLVHRFQSAAEIDVHLDPHGHPDAHSTTQRHFAGK